MNLFRLRERLADASAAPLLIRPITLIDPAVVEIAGFTGADAVMIDCEHGMADRQTVRSMFAHASATGMPAVFRPRSFDAVACRQALDQGAAGVHIPHITTAAEARAVVQACRYAPLGQRQMSLGRAVEYNVGNIGPYVAQANDCVLVVIMIESLLGLNNIKEIAAVPGIDVIHVGVADLTHSMGLKLGQHNPQVEKAVEQIIEASKLHGVAVGYPTEDPEEVLMWARKGVRYFEADTPDYLLRHIFAERTDAVRRVFTDLKMRAEPVARTRG